MNSERIEELLAQIRATAGRETVARVEELVQRLLEVYGGGLARFLAILNEQRSMSPSLENALVADPLLSALMLLHGLHPREAPARIEAALERVRPQLRSHSGNVTFVGIDAQGVAHIRLEGTCDGCASSELTLRQLIHQAIEEAAPEVAGIEVDGAKPATHPPPLIQLARRAP